MQIIIQLRKEERWEIIPGAESGDAFHNRIQRGLSNIAYNHPDQLVVAVVHGGVIGQIISQATGARPFAFLDADIASISQIVIHEVIINQLI